MSGDTYNVPAPSQINVHQHAFPKSWMERFELGFCVGAGMIVGACTVVTAGLLIVSAAKALFA